MGEVVKTSFIQVMMMCKIFLLLFLGLGTEGSNGTLPEWKDLECEEGHKYLFSDITHNWEDSRGECELYGGWLVQINDLKEFNCLMRYGQKEGLEKEYWTDGNDVENTGVWTHAYDNS